MVAHQSDFYTACDCINTTQLQPGGEYMWFRI
jgi:hypothetical protein